jgi:succinyl-diaminopimelate desuccinylase
MPGISSKTDLALLMRELVAMPTYSADKQACHEALAWIRSQLVGLPLHVHEFESNGHEALVFTTRRTKRPKVMLHAHVDIAPSPLKHLQMTEHDGKYFGRGVFDMKVAVAAYIKLLNELGPELEYFDLGITFTTDEEVGSEDGAVALARAGWGGEVILNPDNGPPGIQRASKGGMRLRILSKGVSGHGSRPWDARNAITQLTAFLDNLASEFPAEPCGIPDHDHPTLNVGIIHGGHLANQVPGEAYAEIDIRFPPAKSAADMKRLVQTVVDRHPHMGVEFLAHKEPSLLDINSAPAQRLARIMQDVTGEAPDFFYAHGTSEAPYYEALGMPVLVFGPRGGGHHGADEWVSVKGTSELYEVTRRFVLEAAHD